MNYNNTLLNNALLPNTDGGISVYGGIIQYICPLLSP